jgi:hypothetical protein
MLLKIETPVRGNTHYYANNAKKQGVKNVSPHRQNNNTFVI